MLAESTIAQQLHEFILANFLYGRERELKGDDSLAAQGIVDSTGVLQLTAFLEETFKITVEDEELSPENLDSVSRITAYVCRKQSANRHTSDQESISKDQG
jgi:acyl carrier protein